MSKSILSSIRAYGGRFLGKVAGKDNMWEEIGDKKAVDKVAQALREKDRKPSSGKDETAESTNSSPPPLPSIAKEVSIVIILEGGNKPSGIAACVSGRECIITKVFPFCAVSLTDGYMQQDLMGATVTHIDGELLSADPHNIEELKGIFQGDGKGCVEVQTEVRVTLSSKAVSTPPITITSGTKKATITSGTKKAKAKKDPNKPKVAKTAYRYASEVQRPIINEANPDADLGEMNKLLSEYWRGLSAEDRDPYEKMATIDKKRYIREMAVYISTKEAASLSSTEAASLSSTRTMVSSGTSNHIPNPKAAATTSIVHSKGNDTSEGAVPSLSPSPKASSSTATDTPATKTPDNETSLTRMVSNDSPPSGATTEVEDPILSRFASNVGMMQKQVLVSREQDMIRVVKQMDGVMKNSAQENLDGIIQYFDILEREIKGRCPQAILAEKTRLQKSVSSAQNTLSVTDLDDATKIGLENALENTKTKLKKVNADIALAKVEEDLLLDLLKAKAMKLYDARKAEFMAEDGIELSEDYAVAARIRLKNHVYKNSSE